MNMLAPRRRRLVLVGNGMAGIRTLEEILAREPDAFAQEPGDLCAHPQGETRFGLGRPGKQVQQVPLRHHGDVSMRLPDALEVQVGHRTAVGFQSAPAKFAVRQFREPLPQAQFVE